MVGECLSTDMVLSDTSKPSCAKQKLELWEP